jgi:hypothetical protein
VARLRIGEVVSGTFRLAFGRLPSYARTVGPFSLMVGALGLVELFGLRALLSAPALRGARHLATTALLAAALASSVVLILVIFSVGSLGVLVGMAATSRMDAGGRPSFAEAWAMAAPRIPNFALTSLLVLGAIAGVVFAGALFIKLVVPLLLAIIIALLLLLRWCVAGAVSLFERRSPQDNLRRSRDLTRGSRADIFVAGMAVALVVVVPLAILAIPFAAVSYKVNAPLPPLPLALGRWAAGIVANFLATCSASALIATTYRCLSTPPAAVEPAPPPAAGPAPGPYSDAGGRAEDGP